MTTQSAFDPDSFLNNDSTGANDTVFMPVPSGEYPAVIEKVDARQTDKGRTIMDVSWVLQSPEVQATLGRDKVTVRQSVFIDMSDHGTLDLSKGKNIQLGKLREALGQNDPNKPWRPSYLVGGQAMVTVTQRPDPQDSSVIYNDIKRVAGL